jgi:uncharacterized membrane protein
MLQFSWSRPKAIVNKTDYSTFMACLNQFCSIVCLAAREVSMEFLGNMFMVVFIYLVHDVLRVCTKRN